MPKPKQNTAREKEAAFARLAKATNDELGLIAKNTLGYNPFEVDRLALPSSTRAKLLSIFKDKIVKNQIKFEKHE